MAAKTSKGRASLLQASHVVPQASRRGQPERDVTLRPTLGEGHTPGSAATAIRLKT
jgi:hypothetical protein